MGHKAMTVCCIIAGRIDKSMNTNYQSSLPDLIEKVLDRI
jgi:uridine phosphorylase